MNNNKFLLLAGPCVIESQDNVLFLAEALKKIALNHDVDFYFKASWDKANRTKATNYRGPGLEEGLRILDNVKKQVGVKIVTDIHEPYQAKPVAEVADIIQIPAFLCRQTDLLKAAAGTGKTVNIKKGQFMSPEAMGNAVEKVREASNPNVMLTERGTTFGYQDLIVDFRGVKAMQAFGCPAVLDCTHSLQQPNQPSGVTGGRPDLIETIARAGVAVGFDGLFMETHPEPAKALSDGANMLPLSELRPLLTKLIRIRRAIL